jgi:predicted nuclease of predicted toxin-antitoxin system
MRFLLDANLPARLAQAFIDAGHDCEHMEDLLPRYAPDTAIARIANDSGAVLVSRDADFVLFSKDGLLTVPLIWVRLGNLRRAAMASAIRARLPALVVAIEAGAPIVEVR